MEWIKSTDNPRIKQVIRLKDRKYREQEKLFIIQGMREIELALSAGIKIQSTFFSPLFIEKHPHSSLLNPPHPIQGTSQRVFEKMCHGDYHQGILSVAHTPHFAFADLKNLEQALLLVLVEIEKPGNLGALVRSAAAAGASGVILCEPQTDPYNPLTIRNSIGTVFSLPLIRTSSQETLSFLRNNRIKILATSPHASTHYLDINMKSACAFVLGSEKNGLPVNWLEKADKQIVIPMHRTADSLNVAMTATVLLFEAKRQRMPSK